MSSPRVYVLWHIHEVRKDDRDLSLIGIYSTEEKAKEALAHARTLPVFCDWHDEFSVASYTLDEDLWPHGGGAIRPDEPDILN